MHLKTRGAAYADIVMLDEQIAVYKPLGVDATLYVLGSHENNELILVAALDAMSDALEMLLRQLSKRTLLENFDYVLLVVDETVDKGVLIESDAQLIASRVAMSDKGSAGLTPLHEQSLSQILDTARTEIIRNLKQ